jgi:mannose-6-phosphate isomerase
MENIAGAELGRSGAGLLSQKLETISVEKPWGVTELPPPFEPAAGRRVGEIWFRPPERSPLLVKYIFTSERLSIQVHPDDDQAKARGLASGKEECWYILDAKPGAVLGIGTRNRLGEMELADAARSGAIEEMMEWHPVSAGMFFHIPAGTVHAIGAGVSLVEIQQNADITYRLYDYGRPRELHLADGTAVAVAEPMPDGLKQLVDPDASAWLLDSRHLGVAYLTAADLSLLGEVAGGAMIAPLRGEVSFDGVSARAGECIWTGAARFLETSPDARLLVGWDKG